MILIKNGTLYTMENDQVIQGDILVDNGKIVEVGASVQAPADCQVIDATGKLVFPGFIDAHDHLGMDEEAIGFEGNDTNEMTDPVTPQVRAIDGFNPNDISLQEAREHGVTMVASGPGSANVVGGQFAAFKTVGHRVDDMIVKEPLAMKIAFGENPKRVYNGKGKMPMTRMGTAAVLRETLFKACEYKKAKEEAEKKGETPKLDFKMEPLMPVLNREIPLKAHAHRADDIFTALRIAKEFNVRITLDHCTEGHLIADDLVKEKAVAIVGPSFGSRSKFELKNKSFETPNVLYQAGIKIAIMTDHPVIPCYYLPLMAGLAAQAGLPMLEALKAITINAAEILELEDRVGSLKAGKDADIVIYDKNPILDVDAKAVATLINGEVVYQA